VTINASSDVTITRETQFQQEKLFYWTKYTDTNFYTATYELVNPFIDSVNMVEVYVYMEFANDTTPDYVTARLYDVTNGVYLTRGVNFKADASGVQFYLDSLTTTNRSFTVSYYASGYAQAPSSAIIQVNAYDIVKFKNKNYYHATAQWLNDNPDSFTGTISIAFNFSTDPYIIAPESVEVFDSENSMYLSKSLGQFAFLGNGVTVDTNSVGSVVGNGVRTFEVFWLFTKPMESVEAPNVLHIELIAPFPIIGVLTIYHALLLILGAVGIGASVIRDSKGRRGWYRYKFVTVICFLFIFFLILGY